jgi:two-component system chemotaxis response regulator CheY
MDEKLILVIEDNQSMAELERRHLEKDGFRVITAESGEEALRLIDAGNHPDLLIIDYRLPDMSGVFLMRKLREQGRPVPSIIVTAAGSEEVAVSAMKLGAMDYIVKDIETIRHLPETCRDVLRKINLESENEKLLGDLRSTNADLLEANKRLDELSKKDDLTGIFNRRYLMEALLYEVNRYLRYRTPLSFAIFDLDHFKKVNDTHGHTMGDQVLEQYASLLGTRLRKTDILGRYGGEEFGVVFTGTELNDAIVISEILRETVADFTFGNEQTPIRLTTSAGVAGMDGDMDRKSLIDVADKGLYLAKDSGRNRISSLHNKITE